jgi:hypothetical protein
MKYARSDTFVAWSPTRARCRDTHISPAAR